MWYNAYVPEQIREANLLRNYGITLAKYAEWVIRQGGVCAICHQIETAVTKRSEVKALSVDHDHNTGKIRGLLCHRCNVLLGYALDDMTILASAIAYLNR